MYAIRSYYAQWQAYLVNHAVGHLLGESHQNCAKQGKPAPVMMPQGADLKRRTKMGDEIYLLTTYTPVIDHEGEIIKILSLENDITEQVKMEETLKESKDELGIKLEEAKKEVMEQFKEVEAIKIRTEKTLEGALDAIITMDKNGKIDFFNEAA